MTDAQLRTLELCDALQHKLDTLQAQVATMQRLRVAVNDLLAELPSRCICGKAFRERGILDPACVYCAITPEVAAVKSALAETE